MSDLYADIVKTVYGVFNDNLLVESIGSNENSELSDDSDGSDTDSKGLATDESDVEDNARYHSKLPSESEYEGWFIQRKVVFLELKVLYIKFIYTLNII